MQTLPLPGQECIQVHTQWGGATVSRHEYTYDAGGRRVTYMGQVGATATALRYGYDGLDRLTEVRDLATDALQEVFSYDPFNRLAAVTVPGQPTQSYGYDDQGRRIRVTAGDATTSFLYEGADILAEYTGFLATPTSRYTHGPGIDDPLLVTTASTTQYYHPDGLGSLVALTRSDGSLSATAAYDACESARGAIAERRDGSGGR